jgi:hypothetical protein
MNDFEPAVVAAVKYVTLKTMLAWGVNLLSQATVMYPIFAQIGVPAMYMLSADILGTDLKALPNSIRLVPSDSSQAAVACQLCAKFSWERIGILGHDLSDVLPLQTAIGSKCAALGITVVALQAETTGFPNPVNANSATAQLYINAFTKTAQALQNDGIYMIILSTTNSYSDFAMHALNNLNMILSPYQVFNVWQLDRSTTTLTSDPVLLPLLKYFIGLTCGLPQPGPLAAMNQRWNNTFPNSVPPSSVGVFSDGAVMALRALDQLFVLQNSTCVSNTSVEDQLYTRMAQIPEYQFFWELIVNSTYNGVSGLVQFTRGTGSRVGIWSLINFINGMEVEQCQYSETGVVIKGDCGNVIFSHGTTTPPHDHPELDPEDKISLQTKLLPIIVSLGFVIVGFWVGLITLEQHIASIREGATKKVVDAGRWTVQISAAILAICTWSSGFFSILSIQTVSPNEQDLSISYQLWPIIVSPFFCFVFYLGSSYVGLYVWNQSAVVKYNVTNEPNAPPSPIPTKTIITRKFLFIVLSGFINGTGVVCNFYLQLASIIVPATIQRQNGSLAGAALICMIIFVSLCYLPLYIDKPKIRYGGSFIMALAVIAMNQWSAFSLTFIYNGNVNFGSNILYDDLFLAVAIVTIVSVTVVFIRSVRSLNLSNTSYLGFISSLLDKNNILKARLAQSQKEVAFWEGHAEFLRWQIRMTDLILPVDTNDAILKKNPTFSNLFLFSDRVQVSGAVTALLASGKGSNPDQTDVISAKEITSNTKLKKLRSRASSIECALSPVSSPHQSMSSSSIVTGSAAVTTNSTIITWSVDKILDCPLLKGVLKVCCASTHNEENPLFLIYVREYKRGYTERGSQEQARIIYELFIVPKSELQVNISSTMRNNIADIVLCCNKSVPATIFDPAYEEVKNLVSNGDLKLCENMIISLTRHYGAIIQPPNITPPKKSAEIQVRVEDLSTDNTITPL